MRRSNAVRVLVYKELGSRTAINQTLARKAERPQPPRDYRLHDHFRAPRRGEAMLHAAQRRLRPIVMTAIAAVCGMLPLAFALGAGSQMLQPLAIAVIGGLLVSVFLSLIVTPAIYYRLTRSRHA